MAWKVAAQLEVMLAEMSTPFFSFDWIKTTWYYQSSLKARERRRSLFLKSQESQESTELNESNEIKLSSTEKESINSESN